MKTKKVYIAPVAECYSVQADMVCASLQVKQGSISGTEEGFEKGANTRQIVHEDGLRDWNIDLW